MEIFTILIKKFLIKLWMVKKSLKRMRYILIKFLFYQLEESDIEEDVEFVYDPNEMEGDDSGDSGDLEDMYDDEEFS